MCNVAYVHVCDKHCLKQSPDMLRRAKQKYFYSCINSASNKQFWKTIKSLKRDAVIIPTLTDDDHNEAIGDQDKANMLSSFFSKCFNTIQSPLSDSDTQQLTTDRVDDPDNLDTLLCTEEEVLHLLQTIDTTKANGPDQISGKMLKMTALSIAYPISDIQQIDCKRCSSNVLEIFLCCTYSESQLLQP